ncbi:MAG: FAD-dependent thymidylate synthase [Sedimentisphaerales bacterium]|nr:FAD-dependent thymidylate synthase [Sedimentisphaerales bacterium]MBN2843239.1 FAD-dependent thymidylate synthase [Sedimentisphaerales bacterium]
MNRNVNAKVTLIQHTPNPEQVIASAGKLCYAADTDNILQHSPQDCQKFISMITGIGHLSVLEHVSFTFYIEGVSRAMTHQLVRHRLASYSQRSQRYVNHSSFDYIMPPQLEGKFVTVNGQKIPATLYYQQVMDDIANAYNTLASALGDKGESSNEDARYVLPNACETKIFVTMNARELLHFLQERLCNRAQWEIRDVANQMLTILRDTMPSIFNLAGPKCLATGKCPEGKLTCGKLKEVIAKYKVDTTKP